MALTSLADLRTIVVRKAGDRYGLGLDLTDPVSAPTIADLPTLDEEINNAIRFLVSEAERIGFQPYTKTKTLVVTSGTATIDLNVQLTDGTDPDYRVGLKVYRTDLQDQKIPYYWPEGGDEWEVEHIHAPTADALGRWLWLRYPLVGFFNAPSQDITLEIHYAPIITKLVQVGDTLATINVHFLEAYTDLIGLRAALQLLGDLDSVAYRTSERSYGRRWAEFLSDIHNRVSAMADELIRPDHFAEDY